MSKHHPVARRLSYCGIAGLLSLLTCSVQASSFALIEQSVSGMGTAYAKGSAGMDDASTLFFNPASMTRLPGSNLSLGAHVIHANTDIKNVSAEYNPKNPALGPSPGAGLAGLPISGKTKDDLGLTAVVPTGAISHQYSDKVWFGFTVNAPFGLETEYSDNWAGRYHAIKSELLTINLNPSIAFKLHDFATIGFGVSALYADGELTNAADVGLGAALQGAPIPGWVPGSNTFDSKAKLTGDDWGYGYNFGLLLEPSKYTRFGVHYRSKIDLTLDGDVKLSGPVANSKRDAKLDITLPDSVSVSGYQAITDRWAVMADVTWTQWSRIQTLDIKIDDGSQSVAVWDYEDTTRFAIGTEYRYSQNWMLRTGVAFDESPVPSASKRSPRVPDADRTWFSLGATWHYTPTLSFDFGYAHLFVDDPKLKGVSDNHDPTLTFPAGTTGFHSVSGEYDSSVDILSAQVNWKFR